MSFWTDGVWEWDDILIKYVLRKNLKIDDSFLLHMKDNNWTVPELNINDPELYE